MYQVHSRAKEEFFVFAACTVARGYPGIAAFSNYCACSLILILPLACLAGMFKSKNQPFDFLFEAFTHLAHREYPCAVVHGIRRTRFRKTACALAS